MKKLLIAGLAVFALLAFTMPAMAETKVGGIVFTDVYYRINSKELQGTSDGSTSLRINTGETATRLYGRWTNEKGVGMYIELGLALARRGFTDGFGSDVVVRHAYGWWDISPSFTLMTGASTTPFAPLIPQQIMGTEDGHIIGLTFGNAFSGLTIPQVRGTWHLPDKMGDLNIAICQAGTEVQNEGESLNLFGNGSIDAQIPRVEAALDLYLGNIKLFPGVFWQQTKFNNTPEGYDDSLTAWGATIGTSTGFGPFKLSGEITYGQNFGDTQGSYGARSGAVANPATNEVEDTKGLMYFVDLAYVLGPATINGIWGQASFKNDDLDAASYKLTRTMYGISAPIQLTQSYTLRPEVMHYDYGHSHGEKEGNQTLAGVEFQITF